jgi:hypothetical protein
MVQYIQYYFYFFKARPAADNSALKYSCQISINFSPSEAACPNIIYSGLIALWKNQTKVRAGRQYQKTSSEE